MTHLLAIGAADSSGLRGIAAYCGVARECGVHLLPVTACVVARGASGLVKAVHAVPPMVIARQIDAAAGDFRPEACLVGMLGRHQTVDAVSGRIRRRSLANVVLRPELGVSNGRQLMTPRGGKLTARGLLPGCRAVVVNAETAGPLAGGMEVKSITGARAAGEKLRQMGADWVVLLGQGEAGEQSCLLIGKQEVRLDWNSAGDEELTGDLFAAGVACQLALGHDVPEAAEWARNYLRTAAV